MQLPAELEHTLHRGGGRIVQIQSIAHDLARPKDGMSRDTWHFIGDVEWFDGTQSKSVEIAPFQLVFEGEEREEVDALLGQLNRYLAEHGSYCDASTDHEGWYAHVRVKSA